MTPAGRSDIAEFMRVLVLGGSNSRMKAGYVPAMAEALPDDVIDNQSIGANTCVMAFQALFEVKGTPDRVVIEYSVNDYVLVVSGQIALWEAAFEGLVRSVMRRWPKASVVVLILGRQDASAIRWPDQVRRTRRIAAHYGARVFDAAAWLKRIGREDFHDTMHYRPEVAGLVGGHLARIIARMRPRKRRLPGLLSPQAIYPVEVVDLRDRGERQRFRNSGVDVEAAVLTEPRQIALPGSLFAISFVSNQDAGAFVVESEGRRATVQTLHRQVASGDFVFLPLTAISDWWADEASPRTITVAPTTAEEADWPIYHVGPNPGAQRTYLLSAMVKSAASRRRKQS